MRRLALALLLLATACASPNTVADPPGTTVPSAPAPATSPATTAPTSTTTAPTSDLAARTRALGSAIYDPADATRTVVAPVRLTIPSVDIDQARVVGVGVDGEGAMEIPGATEVGWYRFGPTPTGEGSAVLAAHIAFNGRNGVFVRLADVEPGDVVEVGYDDGSTSRHVVTGVARYPKAELPVDRLFTKTGEPVLTLITCGGDFNPSLRSYSDNVVVTARPLP